MKKTNDRHINDRTVKRHTRRCACFKRAGVLLLCILVWLTSDPSIMDAFTVRAEEENNLKCVITSFLPLPEEVAQQSVCVGTPMEELLFPDTLEAVCTYEDDQELSSDDIEKEDSEDEEKTPEKPKPDDQIPSESEDGDEIPEEPEQGDQSPTESENSDQTSPEPGNGDQTPGESENGDQTSPEPGNGDQTPAEPEDGDQTPKAPEEGDGTPEIPDANGNVPETPGQEGSTSAKPEETDSTTGESEQGGQNAEESVTDMGGNAAGSDANIVYVDKLESMISAVRDKAFSLLGGVSIEETQVTMETNLTKPEEEVEVQVLTNIVTIDSVTWEGIFEYDSELAGCYIFTPVLPEGFLVADDVALPEIVVIVMDEEAETGKAKTRTINAVAELADDAISDKCGDNLTWKYENGTLTISGSGAMYDFDIAPWNEYANEIKSVSIDEGVTTIGNYAFFDCDSLGSVNLPGNITSIGTAAFFGCSSLGSVTIPNGVKSIGSLAFNGCSNLGIVEIPDSVESITAYTFRNCSNAIIYYPASLSGPGDTKDTKANISYTVDGNLTTLKIVSVGDNVSTIHFPKTIGNAEVGAANWNEYEGKITHASFPEHRYTDSTKCTICGEQKAPEIKIDFLREKLIDFEQGETYTYSIAGTSGTISNSTELDIKKNWFGQTISIALQNAGSSTGKTQKLLIPARPKSPTGITTSNVTSKGDDGKILNVTSKMEYWQKGASSGAAVEIKDISGDTVENLPAGTYCVRFKAVENTSFSSEAVEVVIGEFKPVPEETPTAKIDYINESLIGLDAGDTYHIVCGTTEANMTAKTDGSIPFPSDESWFGKEITIVKKGKSPDTTDSKAQKLQIGTRPKAPSGIKTTPATAGQSDGTLSGGTADKDKLEYRVSGTGSWIPITGSTQTGLGAGKYDVRFRASNTEKKFASKSVTVTISSAVMTREPKPTVSINFKDEELTGLTFGDKYLIDGTEITVEEGGVFKLPEKWLGTTINIVKAGDGINTINSEAFELKIPARPKGPTGITTSNVTSKGNDGKLLNVSSKMEYWKKGASPESIVEITGDTVEKLSAGTYYVRFKAVENTSFSSQAVEVVIDEYVPEPEKKPEAKIDYIDEKLIGLIKGETYHISIGTTDEDVTVRADGSIPFPSDDSWLGKLITIVKKGKKTDTRDSEAQVLKIGIRPKAPSDIKTTPATAGQSDGTLSGGTADKDRLEYRVSGTGSWIPITGSTRTGLAAGKYDVRFRASNTEEKFASESVTVTVSYANMTQETTPTVSINFEDEKLTGLKFGDEYLIDDTEITVEKGGVFKLPEEWFDTTIYIVKAGDGIYTTDSDAFELYIPARPSAPADVETEDISVKGGKGKLLNLEDTMEYRPEDSEKWIPVPNNSTQVTGLVAGIYFVRFKATDSSFCSEEAELIIMDFELKAADTPEVQIDYEKEELTGLIKGTYLFSTDDTESSSVNTVKVGTDERIVIKDKWFGCTLYIVRKGDGYSTENSEAQPLDIPERRDAPDDIVTEKESKKGAKDGKLTNVNNTMAYQKKGAKDWTPIVGDEVGPLAPGVYLVCYRAVIGKDFRSESAEYTISAFELIPADTPDLVEISYEDEYFMYLTPYADYKIDGVTVSADADGKIKIRDAWMKNKEISIIQLGDGLSTDKSAPYRIKVPGRHSSPGSVKAVSESAEDANDGKLTGVNDKMEYRVADSVEDSEANWIQIDSDTNTVENLEPAKYKIRYMATDNSFASKSVTRIVYAFGAEPKTPDKSKGDSDEEQEIPTDANSSSSQTEDGSAGGDTAGNAGSKSTGGSDKNASVDGTDAAAIEENTDENGADSISQNTLTGQNAETGSGSNSGNDQDNKSNKENAGKTEPADGASENDAGLTHSESGSLAKTAGDSGASVYTERTAARMSAFYDFLLRLADSRNLVWIAIILAEPILFLLLLIYLLGRKKRDAECQTEN